MIKRRTCATLSALMFFLVIGAGLLIAARRTDTSTDPFASWNGTWKGDFIAYDIQGEERYRIRVEQSYKPAGPGQQSAVFTNHLPDGSIETVHAVNLLRDGKLICRLRTIGPDGKPIGERTEHRGTRIGPGHIIWHRTIGEHGFETFNEQIVGDTYWIHGVSVKGSDPQEAEIFEGRYVRVPEQP
ncbi:MAG: hypothetical protein IIB60_02895 [Planctomycetes bacterium]|nr:hypothetical protein [Planctomycetota bacterium]